MPTKNVTVGQNDAVTVSATAPRVAAGGSRRGDSRGARRQPSRSRERMGDALQPRAFGSNLRKPADRRGGTVFPRSSGPGSLHSTPPFANPPSDVSTVLANGAWLQ
jgi:hypothetical protein